MFIVVFYVFCYGLEYMETGTYTIDWQDIANGYMLKTDSMMGYLWIIRVFLLIMLITPFLLKIKNINSKYLIPILIVCCGVQYLLVCLKDMITDPSLKEFCSDYVLFLTGYSILFVAGIGMSYVKTYSIRQLCLSVVFLIVVLGGYVMLYGLPFHVLSQAMKYPPNFWYLMYGMSFSICVWVVFNRYRKLFSKCKFLEWVGRNTMWLYLWHIICLRIAWRVSDSWIVECVALVIVTVLVYGVQYWVVKKSNNRFLTKYFIG